MASLTASKSRMAQTHGCHRSHSPAGGPLQIAPDGVWTWFNDERALWHLGNYTSYTNYNTEVVGIFQNQLRLRNFQIDPAVGSLTWASSPGKAYRITGSENLLDFPHENAIDIDSERAETSRSFAIPAPLSGSPRAFFRIEEQ